MLSYVSTNGQITKETIAKVFLWISVYLFPWNFLLQAPP